MTRPSTTTSTAPARRNALIIGTVVSLAVIAGLLSAMVLSRPQPVVGGGSPTPSPTPVVTPEPSEEPSEAPASPVVTPEPSDEPSQQPQPPAPPEPTGPSPVVEAPKDVLPPGSLVRVLVEAIKVRTGPTTDAMIVDTADLDELVMISFTYLTQGFGPIEADGFVWYPVILMYTTDLDEVHVAGGDVANVAWMAVGNGTESWVELVEARCPDGDPDLATIEEMLTWERLACFGDRQITLEGSFGCGGCGGMIPGTFEPYWLASPMYYAFLSLEPQARIGPFVLRFAPDGPAMPDDGTIVRVTGHFDDARSSACVVAPGDPNQVVHPTVQELYCRSAFVVDSIEVIGIDEDFPLG